MHFAGHEPVRRFVEFGAQNAEEIRLGDEIELAQPVLRAQAGQVVRQPPREQLRLVFGRRFLLRRRTLPVSGPDGSCQARR